MTQGNDPRADAGEVAVSYGEDERVEVQGGGSLLSERLRSGGAELDESFRRQDVVHEPEAGVLPGPAVQVEIAGDQVGFFVPFTGAKPTEHWLQAFRDARLAWPEHLTQPRLEDGRGVRMGPVPAHALAQHVEALKDRIAATNDLYWREIAPELRRQREEALRREEEAARMREQVSSELKRLLG